MTKKIVLLSSLLWLVCGPAHGAAIRNVNLDELCRSAATIFRGRCTAVETGATELVYTFQSHRFLKGGAGDTVTLRMHRLASRYARAPQFRTGQEVLLFLYPESTKGYSSPVGFGQGVFDIAGGGSGEKIAINQRGNKGLFRGVDLKRRCAGPAFTGIPQSSFRAGALGAEQFMQAVEQTVESQKVQP